MGCICSKGAPEDEIHASDRDKQLNISSVQLVAPAPSLREHPGGIVVGNEGSVRRGQQQQHQPGLKANVTVPFDEGENPRTTIVERPKRNRHQRCATMDMGMGMGTETTIVAVGLQPQMSRIVCLPVGPEGDEVVAGWPSWLTSVAGEAIKGWQPRRADAFEKIDKIGQGTYSSVYKARDLETGKIVALKKVRFANMDPESVRFMAREIHILRKLDHPNVMKLEGLVTSRSGSLYLVFEYMEHDLAGLATTPGIKFTEPQIKCYMQQLIRGLEHCHSRGILHRDIKGSNLLINNAGVLKIGDFGLATTYDPSQNLPLTSRVVTLWYRAPELLLGATKYGAAIDMWSAGCILAELFAGKPIMPGRTEVEQMHKIFKLCGSPSEDYWRKSKSAHATSFKPQQPYKRKVLETFRNIPQSALALVDKLLTIEPENRGSAASALRSEFFKTEPLPCDPSNLPKYPPSKELDAKLRDQEARKRSCHNLLRTLTYMHSLANCRQKAEAVRGRGPESVRRGSRDFTAVRTPEFIPSGQSKPTSISHKFHNQEDSCSGFRIEPPTVGRQNVNSHSSTAVHPSASWNKSTGYVPKKNRIHYSGPLMPPGGNMEDILKEHERQIQHAVRKARLEKSGTNNNGIVVGQPNHYGRYGR
ncbi:protein kinase domain-containing protein [Citrus sinensis]|uniref:Protein kinase domain-containing protein n=1 Tax=Citrus sinensis TaxID=2711 RepID=A0ACB8M7S7_CITSI|nr:protein kinase domain-containing protein [Citrus sinensis]